MKGRGRFESFLGETLAYQESQQIAPETLDRLVARLREGDRSVANQIIIGHLRMVMAILASHRSRAKASDVEGAAFLALVEAVNDACPYTDQYGEYHESVLYDNNITAYITTTVKYAIKDEYGRSHIVRVPPRTIRHKISEGEQFEDLVPGQSVSIDAAVEANSNFVMPFFIPIARPEFPPLEFTEILSKSIENEIERAIIKYRSESYGYEEIGPKVGLGKTRVGQIMEKIEARFDQYNK